MKVSEGGRYALVLNGSINTCIRIHLYTYIYISWMRFRIVVGVVLAGCGWICTGCSLGLSESEWLGVVRCFLVGRTSFGVV